MNAALRRLALAVRSTAFGRALRSVRRLPLVRALGGPRLDRSFGIAAVTGEKPPVPADRGPAPQADPAALKERWEAAAGRFGGSGESGESGERGENRGGDTFCLYRIIGNDIVPRHGKGQSRENLRFILENEAEFPGCEKRFVVNRIVDPAEEQAIRQLLASHGVEYLHIPFSEAEYARQPWDLEGLPEPGYTLSAEYARLPADFRSRLYKRLYRHKNNYLINNNGARNAALEDGSDRARWVLPFDGNCFLTPEAWEEIRRAAAAHPWYPYLIVPMARVADRASLLEPGFRPAADQEPQIAFRSDAGERFDERFYYGRRPKVELLWRLGVPGPWDEWAAEPWDLPIPDYCGDAGAWQWAGWVARLPSGNAALETGRGSETRRLGVRTEAVTAFLRRQDAVVLHARLQSAPALLSDSAPADDRGAALSYAWALLSSLEQATERPVRRVRRLPRARRRAIERARNLLLQHAELPFLLDASRNGHINASLETVREWLLSDAGARAVSRETGTAGTLYSLFEATIAARLGRYEDLSLALLHAADRAALLLGQDRGAAVLTDETHRMAWRGLDALARAAGQPFETERLSVSELLVE